MVGHRVWSIPERNSQGRSFSHTRLDPRDPHIALLSTPAFPVDS